MEIKSANNSRGYTECAMKVNKVRMANAELGKYIRLCSSVAFFGLTAAGVSPIAFIAGGLTITSALRDTYEAEKKLIEANAIKFKFKRIAKRVKATCGINIRPEYNYQTRQAGFVLCDLSGKIPITSFLTSENVSEYLTLEQIKALKDSIDYEFAHMNSYFGKGEQAKTLREFRFRNLPKIGFDNLTCAFDRVGGVLTNKELMSISYGTKISRIEYNQFMKKHKQEELWVFSSHLSTYLDELTDLNVEEKREILSEFKNHFAKYGQEGINQFQDLMYRIKENDEIKRAM